MFWYESHLGGLYYEEEEIPFEYLYCESCGDADRFLGKAGTFGEAWNLLKDDCSIFNEGGKYDLVYVFTILCAAYDVSPDFVNNKYLTNRRIIREIGRLSEEPVRVFHVRKPFIDKDDGSVWFYNDFVFAESQEEAALKKHVDKVYCKAVNI